MTDTEKNRFEELKTISLQRAFSISEETEYNNLLELNMSDAPDTENNPDLFLVDDEETDAFGGTDSDDALLFETDADLPPFEMTAPQVVKLKDGSEFHFVIPTMESEKRFDKLKKQTSTMSPARVNGFFPTQTKEETEIAFRRYFIDNCVKFRGLVLNAGDDPKEFIDAKKQIGVTKIEGKAYPITPAHKVPAKYIRDVLSKFYAGKVEVEKEAGEKSVVVLNETHTVTVTYKFGVVETNDGTFSNPSHVVKFVFREFTTQDAEFWKSNASVTSKVGVKGGGMVTTNYNNTAKLVEFFDQTIQEIDGATVNGEPINARDREHLKQIPVTVKRLAIITAANDEFDEVGN